MSAFGKRCLKYESAFPLAASASFAASGDLIHFISESIESSSEVLGTTFLRLNAPVEKKGGGQSRAQSFSGSLSAVGRREKLWDNGIFVPEIVGHRL